MNLQPYKPNIRTTQYVESVGITKTGHIVFNAFTQEKYNLEGKNHVELIYDRDEMKELGKANNIYIKVLTQGNNNTLKIYKGSASSVSITVNALGFLKSIRYNLTEDRVNYQSELKQINGTDYIQIKLNEPVIEPTTEKATS